MTQDFFFARSSVFSPGTCSRYSVDTHGSNNCPTFRGSFVCFDMSSNRTTTIDQFLSLSQYLLPSGPTIFVLLSQLENING